MRPLLRGPGLLLGQGTGAGAGGRGGSGGSPPRLQAAPGRAHRRPRPTGWRLDVLESPQDASVRVGGPARFTCTLSEAVPVGEATWYINGAAVQPDDPDWTVTADGSHHALLLRGAQPHHAGEVTFAAHDAVASARLTVLSGWLWRLLRGRECVWVGCSAVLVPEGPSGGLRHTVSLVPERGLCCLRGSGPQAQRLTSLWGWTTRHPLPTLGSDPRQAGWAPAGTDGEPPLTSPPPCRPPGPPRGR